MQQLERMGGLSNALPQRGDRIVFELQQTVGELSDEVARDFQATVTPPPRGLQLRSMSSRSGSESPRVGLIAVRGKTCKPRTAGKQFASSILLCFALLCSVIVSWSLVVTYRYAKFFIQDGLFFRCLSVLSSGQSDISYELKVPRKQNFSPNMDRARPDS